MSKRLTSKDALQMVREMAINDPLDKEPCPKCSSPNWQVFHTRSKPCDGDGQAENPNRAPRLCPKCDRNWISGDEECDCE